MKTSLFVVGIISLISFSSLKATTVIFGSNPGNRTINNEAGTAYSGATSGSIWIGTFSNEAGFAATANNSLSVAANVAAITTAGGWEQFSMDTVTGLLNASVTTNTLDFTNIASTARVAGQLTDNTSGATKADFFNGKQIYLWVFNADTVGAATEMGIFEATAATVPWLFPSNGGGVGDSVTLSTLTSGSTIAAVNGVGSISGSELRTEAFGAVVPEPSRLMLLGMAGLGVFFRRRRC